MNTRTAVTIVTLALTLLILGTAGSARADEWKCLFDLRGLWKFEIGDDPHRAEYGFDDSKWESIKAPSPWEDQGFPGYDGYAWYRKHFRSTSDWRQKLLSLQLGTIDDVDEVFLNGHRVGSTGEFPPHYSTAYNWNRIYTFPAEFLNPSGDNVVAIRVYDDELSGGILSGKLGVYEDLSPLNIEIPLYSGWKFSTGDDPHWTEEGFDDSKWKPIIVPAYWESQGYEKYDGFAWYRIKFFLPARLANEHLVLLLGKIDDFDETFVNGKPVGHTGNMATRLHDIPGTNTYTQLRAYVIPPDYLHANGNNVIAVRVYDGYRDGGIYAGPIGITTRDEYRRWQNRQKHTNGFWEWLDSWVK